MPKRQQINIGKYIAVLAITLLIFMSGILIGNYFSTQKLTQIDYIGKELKTDTVSMELQYEILSEDPCEHVNSTVLADELHEMASKLDYMENRLGEEDRDVIDLKEDYALLEIRHWLFMKKTQKECNRTGSLILYFYTNDDDCKNCEEQGFILTWLRRNYQNVYIYSFEYTLENTALDSLKKLYGVTGTPAVVIDRDAYNKFMTKKELEEVMRAKGVPMIVD